ncbi:MAG: hypothetical protein ACN4G0_10900 [Polyangiales bacterium]
MEKGLVRFEAYRATGEDALIIHETFENANVFRVLASARSHTRAKEATSPKTRGTMSEGTIP